MIENLAFATVLSLLLTHEIDAVIRHEWQMFPGYMLIDNDDLGYVIFTVAHIPLFILLLWGLFTGGVIAQRIMLGIDIFSIIHIGLHLLVLKHPRNQFRSLLPWSIIVGAGLAGALDLLLRI